MRYVAVGGNQQAGVTIIELMVSVLIGAIILAGVVQLYANSATHAVTYEGGARIQENSLFAFNRIEQDVVQAGANGCFGLGQAQSPGFNRFVNALGNTAGQYDFSNYVSGIENTGVNNSDHLFVRYADSSARIRIERRVGDQDEMTVNDADADYQDLEQYQIAHIGNCSRMATVMITNDPSASNGVIEFEVDVPSAGALNPGQSNTNLIEELGISVIGGSAGELSSATGSLAYLYGGENIVEYRIGAGAAAGAGACDAASPQNCALFRNNLEIVEGVHDLEVEYGWENNAGNVVYGDWTALSAAGASRSVDRVKVTLTFNSVQRSPQLDGDEFLTKTLARTFMLRNQLPFN